MRRQQLRRLLARYVYSLRSVQSRNRRTRTAAGPDRDVSTQRERKTRACVDAGLLGGQESRSRQTRRQVYQSGCDDSHSPPTPTVVTYATRVETSKSKRLNQNDVPESVGRPGGTARWNPREKRGSTIQRDKIPAPLRCRRYHPGASVLPLTQSPQFGMEPLRPTPVRQQAAASSSVQQPKEHGILSRKGEPIPCVSAETRVTT